MNHLNLKLIDLKIFKLIELIKGEEAEAPNFIFLYNELNSELIIDGLKEISLFDFYNIIGDLCNKKYLIIYNLEHDYNIFIDFDFNNLDEEFWGLL